MDSDASQPEWLTYREAAERLGISRDTVKARARQLGWPRRPGNTPMDTTRIQIAPDGKASARDAILSELQEMLAELEGAPSKHPGPAVRDRVDTQEDLRTMLEAKEVELVEARRELTKLRLALEEADRGSKLS
jgi:hypothetical protein